MPFDLSLCSWACVTFLWVATTLAWRRVYRTSLNLPPGPTRLPILGNIHQLSKEYQEVTFAQWAKKHGMHIRYGIALYDEDCFEGRKSDICQVLHSTSSRHQLSDHSKGLA